MNFDAAVFLAGGDSCVRRHVIFLLELGQLILHPGRIITLRDGDISLVLHQVFEIVSVDGDWHVEIPDVNYDNEDRYKDYELKSRAAAFAASGVKKLFAHRLSCLEEKFFIAVRNEWRKRVGLISLPFTTRARPISSRRIQLRVPAEDFLSRAIAPMIWLVERSFASGSGPQRATASRNDCSASGGSMPRSFEISPATSIP